MRQKQLRSFGLTVFPRNGNNIKWIGLSKAEIVEELRKLNFLTPVQMGTFLSNFSIRGDKKKKGDGYYYSKLISFSGQLELGKTNRFPHYQLILEVKPKITKNKLLNYVSRKLYGEEVSKAISVTVIREDTQAYEDYCKKEERANLPGEYSHMIINETVSFFVNYSQENFQLKNVMENPYSYQKWIIGLVKTEKTSRKIHWIVDMTGNSGKTTLKKYLYLNPQMNCLSVGIESRRAFKSGLASQLEQFKAKRGVEPSALIIDAPRDEENHYIHEMYGILEDVNNGEIYSVFGNSRSIFTFRMGIPIWIFSNTPPRIETLSPDRWDIKGLHRNEKGDDVYIQDAKVVTHITHWSSSGVVWRNCLETRPFNRKSIIGPLNYLDNLLFQMYMKSKTEMEDLEQVADVSVYEKSSYKKDTSGTVSFWGPEETASLHQAPKYVKNKVFKKQHYSRINKENQEN